MAPPIEEFPFDRSRSRPAKSFDSSPEDQFLAQRKSQYEMNQQPPYQAPYQAGGDAFVGQSHESSSSSSLPDYRRILQTPEGLQVLRECNRESFWTRCIPLSTASMFSEVLATKAGYIKVARFPVLRTAMVGLSGYILGRMSYAGRCRQKLERLWRSPDFAERLNELHRNRSQTGAVPAFVQSKGEPVMQPFGGAEDIDVDTSTNVQHQGMDDSYRPSLDNEADFQRSGDTQNTAGPRKTSTYEELRRRNREEHERKLRDQYSRTYGREPQGAPTRNSRTSTASPPSNTYAGESTPDSRASDDYTPDSRPDESYRSV